MADSINLPSGWGEKGGAFDTASEKIDFFNTAGITPEQLLNSGFGVTQADIDWMMGQGYTGGAAPVAAAPAVLPAALPAAAAPAVDYSDYAQDVVVNQAPQVTFTPGLAGQTAQAKAAEYNNLINAGFTDAQIKAAADATFGTQSASDWQYLQNLAAQSTPAFTNPLNNLGAVDNLAIAGALDQSTRSSGIQVKDEVAEAFKNVFGRDPTSTELDALRNQYGMSIEPGEFQNIVLSQRDALQGYGGVDPLTVGSGVVANLTGQILGQNTTAKWGGEGYGSAEKSASDMALLLASAGITDISQFGVRDRVVKTEDQYNEQGNIESYGTSYTVPEYYNKATGQAINPYYDKAQGNTWGGTFAGEGSTAYKVQFQPDGTPIFYSQYGGSSNDLAQIMDDPIIGSIIQGAASYFGGPIGTAAVNLLAGKDIDDVAKAALTSYVAGEVASGVSGSEGVIDTLGKTGANIAGNVASTVVRGGDPVQALITGGIGVATPEIANLIPGYETLTTSQKAFVNNVISSTLRDGDLSPNDLVNAAIAAGKTAEKTARQGVGDLTNRVYDDTMVQAGADAFVRAKEAGASDEDAMAAADAAMGVVVGKIADSDSSNVVTTNAGEDTEFGDLAGAQAAAAARNTVAIGNTEADTPDEAAALAKVRNPSATQFTFGGQTYTMGATQSQINELTTNAKLSEIADAASFSDAYSQARALLGAGKTFTWNGKEYSTDTRNENQSLAAASDAIRLNNIAASTEAGGGRGSAASYANYDVKAAADNYGKTKVIPTDGADYWSDETVYDPATGVAISGSKVTADPNTVLGRAVIAANDALGGIVQTGLSNLAQAGGEQLAAFGGALATIGATDANNVLVQAGKAAQNFGSQIETEESKQGTENIITAVKNAEGVGGKLIAGIKAMAENPAAAVNVITREVLQEVLPAGAALRASKIMSLAAAAGVDTALNAAESMGAAYNDTYDASIKKGMTREAADALATSVALSAGGITLVTSGIADAALIKTVFREGKGTVASQLTKGATKEGISENIEETATALATQFLTTGSVDLNSALTQGAIGHLVGKTAAGSVGAVDVAAQTDNITSSINSAISSGDSSSVAGAINQSVSSAIDSGADAQVVVDAAVTSAISGGANPVDVISNTVTTAIDAGADASVVVNSSVTSGLNAGADVNDVVSAAVSSVVASGGNVNQAIESAITSTATAGKDVSLAVSSSVASAVTSGADAAAATSSAVSSAITSGASASTVVGSSVSSAITSGGNASAVVESAITSAVSSGASAETVVGSAVSSAIASGADASSVVSSSVAAAASSGGSVDTSVASSVSSAVAAGADVNTAVQAAVGAAVDAGNNVNVTSNANITTITNTTTNTQTTVDANTGVTTTVNNNTNVTTVVDANNNTTTTVDANTTTQTKVDGNTQTTTAVDANTNVKTQTVVDSNTNITTTTTVDPNSNTTTQTTTDGNTQTTILTDTDTNTQLTVKVNTDTGKVITETETDIPENWTPPVVETPVVPAAPTPAVTPETPATTDAATKAAPVTQSRALESGLAGAGAMGLPATFDMSPVSLASRVTDKAIDPLARVKQAQAELERDVMMNQIDPRLLGVLQQRIGVEQPNQQQQFDNDIGALAKMLRGEAPANEQSYYSYGSEQSIDDILGGKASNYKEGGYVQPLMAAEGGMALPLMSKSGGALSHYGGREDYKDGKHVAGDGDGQSDDIPAWLADGEFVFPADVVSALGNGSTKAGTDKLYEMMHGIRDRARSKGPKDLPPPALKSPLDYLKSSKRSK